MVVVVYRIGLPRRRHMGGRGQEPARSGKPRTRLRSCDREAASGFGSRTLAKRQEGGVVGEGVQVGLDLLAHGPTAQGRQLQRPQPEWRSRQCIYIYIYICVERERERLSRHWLNGYLA